eukprot:NODE_324_length_9702_cov_1.027491.p11 type:complete len:101 gc:universal NODE_324_length_9702_cov_1.027491:1893-2195(+)
MFGITGSTLTLGIKNKSCRSFSFRFFRSAFAAHVIFLYFKLNIEQFEDCMRYRMQRWIYVLIICAINFLHILHRNIHPTTIKKSFYLNRILFDFSKHSIS